MNAKSKVGVAIAIVMLASLAAYSYASPWLTLKSFREDAVAGKTERMNDYVDFPVLRESLRTQIQYVLTEQVAKEGEDNPFAGLAMLMANAVIDPLVNMMASPSGVVRLAQGKEQSAGASGLPPVLPGASSPGAVPSAPIKNAEAQKAFQGKVRYDGWSRVIVQADDYQHGDPYLVLRREGLFSWKMIDLQLGRKPE